MANERINVMLKFNVLVKDVFPGIDIKDIIYEKITESIKKSSEEMLHVYR